MKIKFKRFSKSAVEPTIGTYRCCGHNLYAAETVLLSLKLSCVIKTDIGFCILRGYFCKIHAQSSVAAQFTSVGGGVIDTDYRSAVSIIFFNHSNKYVQIEEGERFCHIFSQKIAHSPNLIEVEDIGSTQQGIGAFGSEGTRSLCLLQKKIFLIVTFLSMCRKILNGKKETIY